jgi:hypothetical protein
MSAAAFSGRLQELTPMGPGEAMRTVLLGFAWCLLTGCALKADQKPAGTVQAAPELRGVHSGERDQISAFYSVDPSCLVEGYPEVTIIQAPIHGKVSTDKGEDYPAFTSDNVRWDCDRRLVPSTQIFYQSDPGFRGTDSLVIEVRYPDSHVRPQAFSIEVR